MNDALPIILILIGAIVVGVIMLALPGWLFDQAVASTSKVGTGFLVLVVVGVILAYGRALTYLVVTYA